MMQDLSLFLFIAILSCIVSVISSQKPLQPPNIIFIMADDLGWNDVSFHGSDQIPTYNIDSLGFFGIVLNRYYSQPICTPSRASLMTGKYPLHTGLHLPLSGVSRSGMNLSEKILPEHLKNLGYSTHIVGKWHLGFHEDSYTPLQRGFDNHFGYYTGAISYYDHIYLEPLTLKPPYNYTYSGHDLRRMNSSAWDVAGQYATDLFTQEAADIIDNHPKDKPLFLYMSHLAVHAGNDGKPLEAPQSEINRFWYITDPNRRTYAAMVSKLDDSVGKIIEALEKKSILDNSIIVFVSDNGARNNGFFTNYGSNWPWKGQKQTLWEGGVRVPAVVWSPLIKNPSRVSHNLMHITDWLPTLLSAAGYEEQFKDIDGVNQWQAILRGTSSPRRHLVVEIDQTFNMTALVMDDYKYIKGPLFPRENPSSNTFLNVHPTISPRQPGYSLPDLMMSPAWKALQKYSKESGLDKKVQQLRKNATVTCDHDFTKVITCKSEACLFNLKTDPCEQNDVAKSHPQLIKCMEELIEFYKNNSVPDMHYISDPASNPEFFNNTWSPWVV